MQPAKRDPFPYVMGAVIGALVVGLMLVVYLLTSGNNAPTTATNPATGTDNSAGGVTAPDPQSNVNSNPAPAGQTAPRMSMEEFKALYDSPNRPVILDVRSAEAYNEGHIEGAISFPEAEVDARVAELPKDKLIVAYCQ